MSEKNKCCPKLEIQKKLLRSRLVPVAGQNATPTNVAMSEYVYEIMIFNDSDCSFQNLQLSDSLLGGILPPALLPIAPVVTPTTYDITMSYYVQSDFPNLVSSTTAFTAVTNVNSINLLNSTLSRMDPYSYGRLVLYIDVFSTVSAINVSLTNFQNTLVLTGNLVINKCKSVPFAPQYIVSGVDKDEPQLAF